ncbi:carboxymuconolactone decarboxylase family protein [Cohnella cellulosilytica]|uniref:Carboxymuconolactone decarboxylase family protein n=1 Tax=Cohnella cellulosilytica TaxID=986710 RepID=A0ABW2FHC4_9BACL
MTQRFEEGSLDAKTKQLIGLGAALLANNEAHTRMYAQEARALGASDEQIMETVQVAAAAASGQVLANGTAWLQSGWAGNVFGATPLPGEIGRDPDPLRHLQLNAFQDTEFGQDEELPELPEGNLSPSF